MRTIPDTSGPVGYGETSWETGDSTTPLTGKAFYQDMIRRANTVPIIQIFKHYNLRLSEHNRKIICPFKSHKDGRESTASFWWYPETNSFKCYGCGVGGKNAHGCEFMAAMEEISRAKAAYKILKLFSGNVGDEEVLDQESFSERMEIMMEFSNTIREFRQQYIDLNAQSFIENICSIYDDLNLKHKTLNNEALRRIVDTLKVKISSYKPCPTL